MLALVMVTCYSMPSQAEPLPGTVNGDLVNAQGLPLGGVFFEGFSDTTWLQSGAWQWLSEDPSSWSVRSGGYGCSYLHLTITANTNLLGPGNILQNVLLLKQPIANGKAFTAETMVIFRPTKNYQDACLLVYQDSDNYLALGRAFCDPSQAKCVGDAIYFDRDRADCFFCSPNYATAVPTFATEGNVDIPVWLRISRTGTSYSAYYSLDGRNWNFIGTHADVALTNVRVGLTCLSGGLGNLGVAADFDYFALGQR
jgi:alpha-glucuronidase